MGYVVVVMAIINSAALVAFALGFWYLRTDLSLSVGTVMQEEVRRQDDRIEKRLAKREGIPEIDEEPHPIGINDGLRSGRPYRR